jgi:hypothetical protein
MAVTGTVSALSASIKTHFSDDYMDGHQNINAPLLKRFETLKNIKQNGKTFDWEFRIQSPQNISTPADGGATPTLKARLSVAGSVTVGQFVGGFDISPLAEALATSTGSWNGGEVKRSIQETVDDVTKHMNRSYAGTHGTGRIGQVNAATSAVATFVGKLPFGTLLIRPRMNISVYTADSSGSVRDSLDNIQVDKVTNSTRTVTMATGTYTLVANDHIYLGGSYAGRTVNGLRGLVDDGTHLTSLHGVSRSTYEELKSVVLGASGNRRDLTEDLLIDLAHGVRQKSGSNIDLLVMNFGQLAKFFKHVRADRRLNVSGAEVPTFNVGYKKLPTFFVGGQEVEILPSEDVAPREVYGITTSQMKRIQAKKLGWMEWGSGSIFQQTITSSVYTLGKQATLLGLENLATYLPAAHGRLEDLYDPQLCGASVGGDDV